LSGALPRKYFLKNVKNIFFGKREHNQEKAKAFIEDCPRSGKEFGAIKNKNYDLLP
jgi:hypothetical protein